MNEPVIIDALKNDRAAEGAVITQAADGSKGKAAINDNKIVYTPATNATGIDSLDYTVNGSDSFSYKTWDGELFSVAAKVKVTVQPRNDAPRVTVNSGLSVSEGGTATIASSRFTCSDPDNGSADLTVTVTALPVNGMLEKSGASVTLNETFPLNEFVSGIFVYTHNGSETTVDTIIVSVSDGSLSTAATIRVTVTPVNDPPEFSKTAAQMKNSAGLGNFYYDTVVITDSENNLSGLSISVVPAGMTHSLSTSNGRLVLGWCVDNRVYDVGQTVPVSVTVQDGAASVELEWTVTVGKHVWTKVAGDVSTWGSVVAIDSFNIINARCTGSFNDYAHIERKNVSDAAWTELFAWSLPVTSCDVQLGLVNNTLSATSMYETITYDIISTIKSEELSHRPALYFLGQDAVGYYVLDATAGTDFEIHHGNNGMRYFGSTNSDGSTNTISDIDVTGDVTFIIIGIYNPNLGSSTSSLIRWANPWWGGGSLSEDTLMIGSDLNVNIVFTDNNNYDTIFIFGKENALIRIPNAKSPVSSTFRLKQRVASVDGKNPVSITMIDGYMGFLVGSEGKLYYTKDSFGSLAEESLDANMQANIVMLSADKKAIFALTFDLAGKGHIYRY
ncbi:MAG: VCBS domain-containing protein [Chitinispirillaceae bacterium]|nr:VCBS domain-containing protein [Chitinispirillaceae bacterium]